MAAISPGIRMEGKQASDIQFQSLGDKATSSALLTLHTLVRTSFGPRGNLKLLHNNSGGHSVVTSCSMRLFGSLSVSSPVLRLLTSAVQGHVNSFSDGGLFTALLALNVIRNSLLTDVPRRLVMEVHELLLRHGIEYLKSTKCLVRSTIDIGNLQHLTALVQSVMSTKPGCGLSAQDRQHLTGLIVHAFLKTFQGSSDESSLFPQQGIVTHVTLEGRPPSESKLFDGVLIPAPQIPAYRSQPLDCPRLEDGSIRVALFATSLAGDSQDLMDGVYEVLDSDEAPADLSLAILNTLDDLVRSLVAAGVALVCCQRVVHPTIKKQLRLHGLLVIDRLGSSHVTPVQVQTGATLLGSFMQEPPEDAYGRLEVVCHVVLGGRSYLHLVRGSANVCTLVTCQRTESTSDELKHVATVCQDVLRRALTLPVVLAGGGCWQVHLAAVIRNLLVVNDSEWCRQLQCSRRHLADAGHAFCLALDQVAMSASSSHYHVTDSTNHHHWAVSCASMSGGDWCRQGARCCCGQHGSDVTTRFDYLGHEKTTMGARDASSTPGSTAEQQSAIWDLFEIGVNGLKTAVAGANMVLGIQHYIHDTN